MKKCDCANCICLVEGNNGEWICDEVGKPIEKIENCPEASEIPFGNYEIKAKIDIMLKLSKEIMELVGDYGEYADDENEVLDEVANFINAYNNTFN